MNRVKPVKSNSVRPSVWRSLTKWDMKSFRATDQRLKFTLDNRFPEVDELDEGLQLLKGDISQEDDRALLRIVVRQNVLKIIS